jgi:hypothetical protein
MQPSPAKGIIPPETTRRPDRERSAGVRPFDSRELERLSKTNDNDPPYRPWWVIDRD